MEKVLLKRKLAMLLAADMLHKEELSKIRSRHYLRAADLTGVANSSWRVLYHAKQEYGYIEVRNFYVLVLNIHGSTYTSLCRCSV